MDVEHSIESTPAVLKELVAPPCANGGRTRLQEEACDPSEASAKDEGAGSHPNEVGVNNAALEALAAVTDDQLLQRVMKMLTSVASGPVASGEPGLGGDALVAHCVRVKPVVFKVYEKHRSSVCRSPERPLQFTYSSVQWLCEHVGNEIRAVMCVALHYSAVQRDAVSRGVVSAACPAVRVQLSLTGSLWRHPRSLVGRGNGTYLNGQRQQGYGRAAAGTRAGGGGASDDRRCARGRVWA